MGLPLAMQRGAVEQHDQWLSQAAGWLQMLATGVQLPLRQIHSDWTQELVLEMDK